MRPDASYQVSMLQRGPIPQADIEATPTGGTRNSADHVWHRAKRADRVKLLWSDGTGICLLTRRLEGAWFRWPPIEDGRLRLWPSRLAARLEGTAWSRMQNDPEIALNRKNALFAGHSMGAEDRATIVSLIETAKLNAVDLLAWLTDVLEKLVNLWPAARVAEWMPRARPQARRA